MIPCLTDCVKIQKSGAPGPVYSLAIYFRSGSTLWFDGTLEGFNRWAWIDVNIVINGGTVHIHCLARLTPSLPLARTFVLTVALAQMMFTGGTLGVPWTIKAQAGWSNMEVHRSSAPHHTATTGH